MSWWGVFGKFLFAAKDCEALVGVVAAFGLGLYRSGRVRCQWRDDLGQLLQLRPAVCFLGGGKAACTDCFVSGKQAVLVEQA